MNVTRREAHQEEIERDLRLVSFGLLQALEILVDEEFARLMREHARAAPFLLLDQIEAIVATCREDLAGLNNARIELRAERDRSHANSIPLPDVLAGFRHRGNYHGAFASMSDLGRVLGVGLGIPETWMEPSAAAALAARLHRRRELWTFERNGAIHVFGRPHTTADRVLSARAEATTLRLVAQPA